MIQPLVMGCPQTSDHSKHIVHHGNSFPQMQETWSRSNCVGQFTASMAGSRWQVPSPCLQFLQHVVPLSGDTPKSSVIRIFQVTAFPTCKERISRFCDTWLFLFSSSSSSASHYCQLADPMGPATPNYWRELQITFEAMWQKVRQFECQKECQEILQYNTIWECQLKWQIHVRWNIIIYAR